MDTPTPDGRAPSPNRGAAMLRLWLASTGRSQTDFARTLGVDPRVVRRWIAEGTVPELATRERIAYHAQIHPAAWTDQTGIDVLDHAAGVVSEGTS